MPKIKIKHVPITPTKIKTIILSVVIAIVLSGFVIYLTQTIYPRPEYEDYCGKVDVISRPILTDKGEQIINQTACEKQGGKWKNGYCDYYLECNEKYDDASNHYKLIVFIVSVIAGLIAVSVGIILALPSVSSGLMLGGTFLTFYGTAIYWSNLSNLLKTLVLGAVLAVLIWLGYKKLQN